MGDEHILPLSRYCGKPIARPGCSAATDIKTLQNRIYRLCELQMFAFWMDDELCLRKLEESDVLHLSIIKNVIGTKIPKNQIYVAQNRN